jgi:hypothetical protein
VNSQKAGVERGLSFEKGAKKTSLKTIPAVGKQVPKATIITPRMGPADTLANSTIPSTSMVAEKMMSSISGKRMVAPLSKDAPKFKSSKPEELRRFIDLMEDLWREYGVTDDQKKKTMIGKYADRESEEEWIAFDTFDATHSWEEFKEELIENYPEAAAAERGTPARIRQLCADAGKIRLGDMSALYAFSRSFRSEARKLQKPPAAMANRELVELFVGCLADSLASAVLQYLGNKSDHADSPSAKGKTAEDASKMTTRRPEDKYDIDDICKAAISVSANAQSMYNLIEKTSERNVLLFSQPVTETKVLTEKLSELEGEQALDKDRLVSLGKTLDARMGGIEDMIKSFMKHAKDNDVCKGECKGVGCKIHETSSTPAQKWGGRSLDNEKCFWCGLFGHFQADCEDLRTQVRLGNVKMNHDGKLRLKDGSFIPKLTTEASLKERVEKHYARKPSQYFYGEYEDDDPTPPAGASILSQLLGASNDADKRTIAQLKAELDLRKREEALELKRKLLDQSEKMTEQASGSTRAANVLDLLGQLTDEELVALKAAKSGFT